MLAMQTILFIDPQEIVVILLAVVVLFGPNKLPEMAREMARLVRTMRRATDDIKKEIFDPINDINPISQIKNDFKGEVKKISDSVLEDTNLPKNPITEAKESLSKELSPLKEIKQVIKEEITGSIPRDF